MLNLAWIVNKQVWLLINEQIEGHGSFNVSLRGGGGGGLSTSESIFKLCMLLAGSRSLIVSLAWLKLGTSYDHDCVMTLGMFWLYCPLRNNLYQSKSFAIGQVTWYCRANVIWETARGCELDSVWLECLLGFVCMQDVGWDCRTSLSWIRRKLVHENGRLISLRTVPRFDCCNSRA